MHSLCSQRLRDGTRASSANEADRMSKRGPNFSQNLADGICNCGRTAPGKEKADWLVAAIVGYKDRKSKRLNSSHTEIYTLSLHDALPICPNFSQNLADGICNCGRTAPGKEKADWLVAAIVGY